MAIYLAIDLGTTGCRSILFDAGAAMLAARAVGQELPPLEYANTYVPKRDYEEKYKAFRAVEYRLWKEEKA